MHPSGYKTMMSTIAARYLTKHRRTLNVYSECKRYLILDSFVQEIERPLSHCVKSRVGFREAQIVNAFLFE